MNRILVVTEPSRIPEPSWVGLIATSGDAVSRIIERPSQYEDARLALHGAASALSRFRHDDVELVLEDGNLVRTAAKWLPDWAAHHWTVSTGRSVKNEDAWRLIWSLLPGRQVTWTHGRKDPTMREAHEWLAGVITGRPVAAKQPTEPVAEAPAETTHEPAAESAPAPITTPATRPAREVSKMRDITITIAAQAANPAVNAGPVGFAAAIAETGMPGTVVPGRSARTSLPRMLAEGTLAALDRVWQRLPAGEKVALRVCAPQYVISCLRNSPTWAAQTWRKADGFPVRHADTWEQVLALTDAMADSMALVIDERGESVDKAHDAALRVAGEQLAAAVAKARK